MKRRKFTNGEKITLTVLSIILAAVIGAGAYVIVNNVNTANREATNTTHTTIKLTTQPETKEETNAAEKYAEKTKKKDSSENKTSKTKKSVTTSSKTSTAKNKTASKPKTASKNPKKSTKTAKTVSIVKSSGSNAQKILLVTPKVNKTHKSKDKCIINGTTCYVGDTIKITVNLKYSEILENYQGYTTFDSEYLSCKSVKANIGLANNDGNKIYFNASVLTGLDFTSNGTIYSAEFKVKKSGSSKITNTMEIITDIKEKDVKPAAVKDTITVFG